MSDDPIKFRCYRCSKLLGASSRRAGAVVTCPQCRAEIQVPVASSDESADPPPAAETTPEEPGFQAILVVDEPEASFLPPISYDASPRPSAPPVPRAPDVVLPPAVVLAWSLLVLAVIPMAFTAGLLIGHFLWK